MRPPKSSLIPTWDFGLVLRTLLLAPFEPLATASLEAITYKTFALIAFALGTRRGELCALRRDQFVRPAEDWSFVLFFSDPSFIPKTAKGSLPTEPYKLRTLPPSSPPLECRNDVGSCALSEPSRLIWIKQRNLRLLATERRYSFR